MIFFICIMLVMSSGLMMIYTIGGEPRSHQHAEDIKIIRWVSVILLIAALGIGFIFK